MRAMVSQPMAGKSNEEIVTTRARAIKELKALGYDDIANTLLPKEQIEKRGVVQIPLLYLAKSLEAMANCHAVYFCEGWENARGCKFEHDAAVAYGLTVFHED